jgi:hypothetical protein
VSVGAYLRADDAIHTHPSIASPCMHTHQSACQTLRGGEGGNKHSYQPAYHFLSLLYCRAAQLPAHPNKNVQLLAVRWPRYLTKSADARSQPSLFGRELGTLCMRSVIFVFFKQYYVPTLLMDETNLTRGLSMVSASRRKPVHCPDEIPVRSVPHMWWFETTYVCTVHTYTR